MVRAAICSEDTVKSFGMGLFRFVGGLRDRILGIPHVVGAEAAQEIAFMLSELQRFVPDGAARGHPVK